MTKTKTAGEKATATAESALESGAAALKTGLEKALKSYDVFVGYGKDTAEAVMKSATVAGKGATFLKNTVAGEYKASKAEVDQTGAHIDITGQWIKGETRTLATSRANNAKKYLIRYGVPSGAIRVIAASRKPSRKSPSWWSS